MATKKTAAKAAPKEKPADPRMGLPSASAFPMLELCPGRHLACQGLEDEKTAAATRGTKIHAVLEGAIPISELSDSDQRTAHEIMDCEARLVDEYNFHGAKKHAEQRIFFNDKQMLPLYSGQPDLVLEKGPEAMMNEYKSGWTSVGDVRSNKQVWSNVALIANYYGSTRIIAALIHPHLGKPYQVCVFGPEEIAQVTEWAVKIARAAMQPTAPRCAGSKQCQWCEAKSKCKEYLLWIDEAMKCTKPIADMTPEERGDRVRALKMAGKRIEWELGIYQELLERDPESIEGFRLFARTDKVFADEEKAYHALVKEYGIDMLFAVMSLSVAKAREWLKKAKGLGDEAAKLKLNELAGLKDKKCKASMREA